MALKKKGGAISMGGVGKGEGTVYPLYSGIFVLLNKIVLKINVSSRALILDVNSCRVPQTKDIIFMCMNPNVALFLNTQKKSLEVTLNHKPNSPFVFTSKENTN